MAKDPVCGMDVDPNKAAGRSVHEGVNVYFCNLKCKARFDAEPERYMKPAARPHMRETAPDAHDTAKDPVCGMVVDKAHSLSASIGGRTYYFCSEGCLRTFEAPEAEMKGLKRRVSIALFGVLLLAIFRAGIFIGLAAGATLLTWAPIKALPWFTWGVWLFILVTPVQFIGGWGFYKGAYNAVKNRMINMDFLIALGTSVAYVYSVAVVFAPDMLPIKVEQRDVYFEVSAVIIAFVLLGKYMEEIIKKKSSAAIRRLMDLRPLTASVVRNGVETEVPAESVMPGEVVVVRPGAKFAADGVVIEGRSSVDEKMLTGESMPVEKKAGDQVIGGTLNKAGVLKFKATRVGSETTLGQIIKMVEEAQASTAPIQRIADRATAYFVPAVIGASILAFFGWWLVMGNFPQAVLSFIAVLIIACPCALGIATPAALMVGVGKGAEVGILIRGGEFLERAERLTTVVFDKTGTLTKGEPSVTDVVPVSGKEDDVMFYAAVSEKGSEHPLAEAILKMAEMKGLMVPDASSFEAIAGHGVKAVLDGKTVLFGNRRLLRESGVSIDGHEDRLKALEEEGKTAMLLALDKELIGIVAVADTLKDNSKEAVQTLKDEGIEVVMLTGDNERTAKAVAGSLGIEGVIANVLPGEKAGVIKDLRQKGRVVAMVGDGINDSPALAEADIGIAIGSGSDVAKETGGIILVKDDLRDVIRGIRLSRATMRRIKMNLFWAFFYNSVGIPIAALGLLNPILASAAMALSSLSVVTNSALLKRVRL